MRLERQPYGWLVIWRCGSCGLEGSEPSTWQDYGECWAQARRVLARRHILGPSGAALCSRCKNPRRAERAER